MEEVRQKSEKIYKNVLHQKFVEKKIEKKFIPKALEKNRFFFEMLNLKNK